MKKLWKMSGCAPAWGYNTELHVPIKREVTPLFWVDLIFEWYEDAIVFLISLVLFLFRTNGKKGHLYENDFRHCYGISFWKWHSESHLITAMFKVPSQQLQSTLKTAFWKIPYSWNLRTWINMRAKPFI